MEWIETTGATLDEAKERALDRLGVAEDELEYEVLAEATRSMLGLRRTEARMRARVRPTSPRPKVERRDRNRRGDRSRSGGGRARQGGGRSGGKPRDDRSRGDESADDQKDPGSGGDRRRRGTGRSSDGDQGVGKTGRQNGGGEDRKTQPADQPVAGNDRGNREKRVDVEKMDLQTQAEITEDFLQGLLDEMGLDAKVSSRIEEDRLTVEAHGLNLGLAIGQGGATVRAITELSRTLIQRRSEGSAAGSLVVDVGGYRERRRSFLEEFARTQAEAVLVDGVSRALEPMAAADRKIVHDAVSEIDGVQTASEGSDSDRRVVLLPDTEG